MRNSPLLAIGTHLLALLAFVALAIIASRASAQQLREPYRCIYPEARCIQHRCPSGLCQLPIPETPLPPTVADPQYDTRQEQLLSLDEAICMALQNAEVIRVLSGQSANSTGNTIYDPAISNTQIDVARGLFDPSFNVSNTWGRTNLPGLVGVDTDADMVPDLFDLRGGDDDSYFFGLGLSQTKPHGGVASLDVTANPTRSSIPGGLNPSTRSSLRLNYVQPFLQGAGTGVNLAPIVIARLDTERSYFQLKDSVQEMVRSVIDGYWGLVLARTQLWANEQQIKQAEYAYDRLKAEQEAGRSDIGDTAQAAVSLASFRANYISTQGDLLNREAAFRNVLGLPPVDNVHFVPSTPPQDGRAELDWESMITTAEQNRPDIIELKLILEADQQRRLVANNNAMPQLDANASYQWNGLQGTSPGGPLTTRFGQFADWQLGVNFSVPLGLRASRANLRQIELLLARDRANINQQLHQVHHQLAQSIRSIELAFAQYEAFSKVREASRINLERIFKVFDIGGLPTENINYLQVLQAITDWGNSVTSEASALTRYNSELANLERQLGTILENHSIRFYEEHFASLGPHGRCKPNQCYPKSIAPDCGEQRYDFGEGPAENEFNLDTIEFGSDAAAQQDLEPRVESDDSSNALPGYMPQSQEQLRERLKRLEKEIEANEALNEPAVLNDGNASKPF